MEARGSEIQDPPCRKLEASLEYMRQCVFSIPEKKKRVDMIFKKEGGVLSETREIFQWLRALSFTGPRFSSQYPHSCLQLSVVQVSGDSTPFSDFCGHQVPRHS